jgi:hypothetical protein
MMRLRKVPIHPRGEEGSRSVRPSGKERGTKEERMGRREDVPVQDGWNIRSDVDVKSERKLAQSQNHKGKTRDGEGEILVDSD